MMKKIIKRILIGLGIVFVVLVVFGGIFIIVVSLGGARYKAPSPSGPLALEAPSSGLEIGIPWGREAGTTEEVVSETPSRLVIKTGTINLVVKEVESSVKSIVEYAESKGGWVVSSTVTEREKVPYGYITVRVPAEIFDEALAHFRGLAEKVTYERTQGQDVTEEYVDLQSQLRNLEATETQLLKIMERTGTITEVLNVQRELTNVRDRIERIKGRMQYLEQSAKMATITVNLSLSEELLPIPPAEKWRPKYILIRAWRSVLGSLRDISYLLIWIIVYGLVWIPLGIIIWQVRKFWKKREKAKEI